MNNSYWSPLSDVLPDDVIRAMDASVTKNLHSVAPRDEPGVLSGVRGLLEHMVLKSEHDALISQWVLQQRRDSEESRTAVAAERTRLLEEIKEELAALKAVRDLVYRSGGRKTLRVDDVRAALAPDKR